MKVEMAGGGGQTAGGPELEEVQPEPLDLSIPTDSVAKTITYFILLPIVFPLWLTLPDTRKQSCKFLISLSLFHPFSPPSRAAPVATAAVQRRKRKRTSPWICHGRQRAGNG
jgi:hypothetical protein